MWDNDFLKNLLALPRSLSFTSSSFLCVHCHVLLEMLSHARGEHFERPLTATKTRVYAVLPRSVLSVQIFQSLLLEARKTALCFPVNDQNSNECAFRADRVAG